MSNQTEGQKIIDYVRIMIETMKKPELVQFRKDSPKEYKQFMMQQFSQLREKSLTLFEMVLTQGDKFELDRLAKMMNLRDTVFEDKTTTYAAASKKLGQEYFDEYVKPNLDKAKRK